MMYQGNPHGTGVSEKLIILLVSYSYVNLATVFVIQNLLSSNHMLISYLLLNIIGIWPARYLVRSVNHYLSQFSPLLYAGFTFLMLVCGALFYASGPVDLPGNIVLQAIGFPSILDYITGIVTVITVGGSGLALLLTKAVRQDDKRASTPQFIAVNLFFVIYLVVGLLVYSDYGIGVDEHAQRRHSLVSINHVFRTIDPESELVGDQIPINEYRSRYYPVAFQLPLVTVELLNDFDSDISSVWLYRHFATFLFFFCSVVAFYRLTYEKFLSWQLALVGAGFLIMTPHIFGQSFNQIKDAVFLASFTISLYLGFRYWRLRTIRAALLFGA